VKDVKKLRVTSGRAINCCDSGSEVTMHHIDQVKTTLCKQSYLLLLAMSDVLCMTDGISNECTGNLYPSQC
jgi:hypothetical protein